MENKRKEQILKEVQLTYTKWQKSLLPNFKESQFEKNLQTICQENSQGIVVNQAQDRNYCSFIGSSSKCNLLRKKFGGYVKRHHYYYIWRGTVTSKEIFETFRKFGLKNPLRYTVNNWEDQLEISKLICEQISIDTKLARNDYMIYGYCGPLGICRMIKKNFEGRVHRQGDIWYWIGVKGSFKDISEVVELYRKILKTKKG